jgi:glutamate synthase (NADPH/NADH) large chain
VDGQFATRANTAMVDLEPLLSEQEQQAKLKPEFWHQHEADESILRRLIQQHADFTGSRRARDILAGWAEQRGLFIKVFPKDYRRALGENAAAGRDAA